MKKLLIIPALCLVFLLMQGSGVMTYFKFYSDSLKSGSDTTDTYSILTSHNTLYQFQYLTVKDTGSSRTDSLKVYGTDDLGNKFLCQLENLSAGSATYTTVTNVANATTVYKINPPFLKEIEIVRNGNSIYIADSRVDYTLLLVNE